jgi:hypothetical protein
MVFQYFFNVSANTWHISRTLAFWMKPPRIAARKIMMPGVLIQLKDKAFPPSPV